MDFQSGFSRESVYLQALTEVEMRRHYNVKTISVSGIGEDSSLEGNRHRLFAGGNLVSRIQFCLACFFAWVLRKDSVCEFTIGS